jgi:nucleoside-diphosphate-sugar epimerase
MHFNNRVLVTGCSGVVGGKLVEELCVLGFTVIGIRGKRPCRVKSDSHHCLSIDILSEDLSQYIRDARADFLIHTAWEMTPKSYWNDPINFSWTSASILLVQRFLDFGGEKVFVTGSCAEYSWLSETELSELSKEDPTSAYGKSKLDLLRFFQTEKIPHLWTRTFFQFGNDRHSNKLIPTIINSTLAGVESSLSNPHHIRDYIYIDDVVTILTKLVASNQSGVVNVGSGNGTTTSDVVQHVGDALGMEPKVKYTDQDGPSTSIIADVKHLRELLGEFEMQPFARSIECTINDYLKPS